MGKNLVVGLDIGTSSIKVAVIENRNNQSEVKLMFKEPSLGLRRGAIVDLTECSQAVGKSLAKIRNGFKSGVKNIYVNAGSSQIRAQKSKGVVAVSRADNEIYRDDIDRVVRASQAISLEPNRSIIHTITREYTIDGVGGIADPLGLSGSRLEVNSLVIDAFTPHIKNLIKVIDLVGGSVGDLLFTPLAASRSVLSKVQKDLGVVLVDIGFGTTGLSVYEENRILGVASFPVGAGNITNDLAIGLKIPVEAAEKIKLNYGYALAKEVGLKESIELEKIYPEGKGVVSRRFVAEVIEARMVEIFEFINNELKLMGKAGDFAGGVVFVGGGAKLPGLTELSRRELKLFSQIGFTNNDNRLVVPPAFGDLVDDPEFVNSIGLALFGGERNSWRPGTAIDSTGVVGKIKKIFNYFTP